MTEDQINRSLYTKELQLSRADKLSHFRFAFFMFLVPVLIIVLHLWQFFTKKPVTYWNYELLILAILTLSGSVIYFIQKKKLKLTLIKTSLSRTELERIINRIADDYEWIPFYINENAIVAKTHGLPRLQITILFSYNAVLVNSIVDPEQNDIDSIGRNKRNIQRIQEEIYKASC